MAEDETVEGSATTGAGAFATQRAVPAVIVAIVLLAAMLRLHDLGTKSLWLDEAITAHAATLPTLQSVLGWAAIWIDNTPFVFVVTWLLRPLGGSEAAVRLPMVVAGILLVPAMYRVGVRFGGVPVGLVAAALAALSPFSVYYSQEARAYSFLLLLTAIQLGETLSVADGTSRWAWARLGLATAGALHVSHLAIASTLACFGSLAVLIAFDRSGRSAMHREGGSAHRPRMMAVDFVRAAAIAGVLYLPLVPTLQAFLTRSDLGVGRLGSGARQVGTVVELLAALDLAGTVAGLAAAGVAISLANAIAAKDRPSVALLTWLALPVTIYVALARGDLTAIWPRYLAPIYPAILLSLSVGVVSVGRGAAALAGRAATLSTRAIANVVPGPPILRGLVTGACAGVVAFQWLPAVATSYATPKGEDNRAAVATILESAPPSAVVAPVGQHSDWLVVTLGHYLWLAESQVEIVDPSVMSADELEAVRGAPELWGVLLTDWNDRADPFPPGGVPFRVRGIDLVRLPSSSRDLGALRALIDWAVRFDDRLTRTGRLLDVIESPLAPNALPPIVSNGGATSGWHLPADADVEPSGRGIAMSPAGSEQNAAVTVAATPDRDYALTFRCSSSTGSRAVAYVTAGSIDEIAHPGTPVFPNGAGFRCPAGEHRDRLGFMFKVPTAVTRVTVWLRATGRGRVSFDDVWLSQLP